MNDGDRILQLIGTFLPVYGVILTIILGISCKGRARAVALLIVPLVTYLLCTGFGESIAYDGNMLYVALLAVFVAVLPVYYPVLLVFWGLKWVRAKREGHSS